MRRAIKRLPSAKVFAACNLAAILVLFGFVQWRIDNSGSKSVRLDLPSWDPTEQDMASEAFSLEGIARKRLASDRQFRAMAPPMDWEAIASDGADKIAAQWNESADKQWFKQPGFHLAYPEADPVYPFQRIKLTDGQDTGIIMLAAPFYDTNYYRLIGGSIPNLYPAKLNSGDTFSIALKTTSAHPYVIIVSERIQVGRISTLGMAQCLDGFARGSKAKICRAEAARGLFWRLKAKGHIMVGITSYQEFPGPIMNPYDDRHTTKQDEIVFNAIDAWLHCFRTPDEVLPIGVPRLLLSESDFHDPERNDGGGVLIPNPDIVKVYDLVYSNQGGDWNDFARNWTLAKASFSNLIDELGFKILILGHTIDPKKDQEIQPYIDSGHITLKPPGVQWKDFLLSLQTAKSIFVPNVHDASPRVVAEALCFDMPVVMNRHIVGGWKYVNDYTGEFFSDSSDVVDAYRRLRDKASKLAPRDYFSVRFLRTGGPLENGDQLIVCKPSWKQLWVKTDCTQFKEILQLFKQASRRDKCSQIWYSSSLKKAVALVQS